MMLVRDGDTLFMALPEREPLYGGFTPIIFSDVPSEPDLLAGDQLGYDRLFRNT